MRGEEGTPGEPGVDGEPGEEGERGGAGEKGVRGEKGEEGEPGRPGREGGPGLPGIPGVRTCEGETSCFRRLGKCYASSGIKVSVACKAGYAAVSIRKNTRFWGLTCCEIIKELG